jgi:hypothetical protein
VECAGIDFILSKLTKDKDLLTAKSYSVKLLELKFNI